MKRSKPVVQQDQMTLRVQEHIEAYQTKREKVANKIEVRNETFMTQLGAFHLANPIPRALPYKGKKNKKTSRILNLMLSDLHYGANLVEAETGNRYGALEEARRTAAVVAQTADHKRQYRDDTILYVHLLGDIIQGKLHDPESAAPLTEQFARASWYLRQALRFLASEFKEVVVRCTPGNHGRRKDRHPDRAVNQKWDSIEGMLYVDLKMSLATIPNIRVEIPMKPYYIYEAFDRKGFMTHGDTVISVGYPGKAIPVESIRRQINEMNNKEHCHLYGAGHVHTSSKVRLPNGVVVVTNGCMIPSDDYAQSIGIMETSCSQQLWESVPGYIFGDSRDILVDSTTDEDKSLDRIIKVFPGMPEFGRVAMEGDDE